MTGYSSVRGETNAPQHMEGMPMTASPVCKFKRSIGNARVFGVGSALAIFIGVRIVAASPLDALGIMAIVLPALTVSMVLAVFAVYGDGLADTTRAMRECAALAVWFAASLAAMWLYAAFVRAAIEAYGWAGVPPLFDLSI
jgi:small ligand-binding sensory domain FIST